VAGPSIAAPTKAPLVGSPGLAKLILGVNAAPGVAQAFSESHGVQYYRMAINFNNGTIRAVNEQARITGVDYLGILDSSTMGVVRGGNSPHKYCAANCNWTLDDWKSTVRKALADYPTIHEWEIWNEPYSSTQHSGYLTNASTYFTMVKSAHWLIKQYDKNDTVVCLGGSGVAISSALTFSTAFWSHGAGRECDAISLHAYISGTALLNTSAYERSEWPKNIHQYENLTSKPIWITEYGRQSSGASSTSSYSTQNQNYFISQATALFANLSFVKRAYVFDLATQSISSSSPDFGLLNSTTLKPKIAWYTFKSLYASSLSHIQVAVVSEALPTIHIAKLTIAKGLQDNVTASAPSQVDPIEILVKGKMKAIGTGSISYGFVGSLAIKYTITAYDKFTGLNVTRTITVI
jgi:hypothetical protein